MRPFTTGKPPVRAGAITVLITVLVVGVVFTHWNPFADPYEMRVVVNDSLIVRVGSPVRIAGVDVGAVESVDPVPGSTRSTITLAIDDNGLPVFRDAHVKIRPRLFFEGNYFIDLQPGTPGTPELPDGGTIPVANTDYPVQLDQVLSTFPLGVRRSLQVLINGYGSALSGRSTPAEDRDQDASVRGLTAAGALNQSLRYAPGALRGLAITSNALLGRRPRDVSRLVAGQRRVALGLSRHEQHLGDAVVNLQRTMAVLARRRLELGATLEELPPLLATANDTLVALDNAFPATRALARTSIPGVQELGPTIQAGFPWVRQTAALVSPAELGGLVNELEPAVADLAPLQVETLDLLPQLDLVNRCLSDAVLPTLERPVDDGALSTGAPNYQEFWQTMVGFSGESQNFDGNGQYTRFQIGGGANTVSSGPTSSGGPAFYGNATAPPRGSRPARPGSRPPYRTDVPCYRSGAPNLTAKTGPGP
jgi:ABC-type transporter Mla subunit MlaD